MWSSTSTSSPGAISRRRLPAGIRLNDGTAPRSAARRTMKTVSAASCPGRSGHGHASRAPARRCRRRAWRRSTGGRQSSGSRTAGTRRGASIRLRARSRDRRRAPSRTPGGPWAEASPAYPRPLPPARAAPPAGFMGRHATSASGKNPRVEVARAIRYRSLHPGSPFACPSWSNRSTTGGASARPPRGGGRALSASVRVRPRAACGAPGARIGTRRGARAGRPSPPSSGPSPGSPKSRQDELSRSPRWPAKLQVMARRATSTRPVCSFLENLDLGDYLGVEGALIGREPES